MEYSGLSPLKQLAQWYYLLLHVLIYVLKAILLLSKRDENLPK